LACFVDCLFDICRCDFNHCFFSVFLLTDKNNSTTGSYDMSTSGSKKRRKHSFYRW
jgi:hypothetical protein